MLVVPVDVAVVVIVLGFIQRVNLVEIVANRSNMISDNIYHDPDAFVVTSLHKVGEILSRTEVVVELFPVSSPVSMVASVHVLDNWTDPNSIEAHSCDVVQVVLDSLVSSTAVVSQVIARTASAAALRESISKDLIHTSLFPIVSVSSSCASDHACSGKSQLF